MCRADLLPGRPLSLHDGIQTVQTMKSEHRHELAENDLSKLLARWGAEFDKHANTILSVLIVIALVAAGIIYWTRTSAATSAAGWTDLTRAGTAEDFQNVAEDYSGTPVALWATLRAGDGFLREGIRLSLTDRTASDERLTQARDSYDALLKNATAPAVVREQALLGYAVTLETLSDGDTSQAVAAYEKLLEEFPQSRFARYATDRVAELRTGGAQDFYAWYHQLKPTRPDRPGPQDQLSVPDGSDLSNLLPELGGSGIPLSTPDSAGAKPAGADAAVNPFEEMKDDAAPAADTPQPDAAPAGDENEAATPPADESAAPASDEAKPADKPADQAADSAAEKPAADESAPAEDKDASGDAPAEAEKPAEEPADSSSE